MEFKTLFLGLFFSIGVFAANSGLGVALFLRTSGKRQEKLVRAVLFGYAAAYLAVFLASGLVLETMDMGALYHGAQRLFQSGMFIHVIMAGILIVWGTRTLIANGEGGYGWSALVFPCPVCVTVIFFTSAFLNSIFSCSGTVVAMSAWAFFMATSLLTARMASAVSDIFFDPRDLLGNAMVAVAGYFTLSVLVMPQFGDISKIYRLAAYSQVGSGAGTGGKVWCMVAVAVLFAVGAGFKQMEILRKEGR